MIKSHLLRHSIISFSTFLLLTGTSFADEEYDVKLYGPKSEIIWNKPIKATFGHKVHTMDAGLECAECHDTVFSMQRGTAVKSHNFTMKAMVEGQFCGSCHDGDTAFATDSNVWHAMEPPKSL